MGGRTWAPTATDCATDLDGDGDTDVDDLTLVILNWSPLGCGPPCIGDVDGDGDVDVDDLVAVILGWGRCGEFLGVSAPGPVVDCLYMFYDILYNGGDVRSYELCVELMCENDDCE